MLYARVAVLLDPVRVPIDDNLSRFSCQLHLSANNKGNNYTETGGWISWYLAYGWIKPWKLQLQDSLVKAVQLVNASNEFLYLQMMLVGLHNRPGGIMKSRRKGWEGGEENSNDVYPKQLKLLLFWFHFFIWGWVFFYFFNRYEFPALRLAFHGLNLS